jgi:hypothetical protein
LGTHGAQSPRRRSQDLEAELSRNGDHLIIIRGQATLGDFLEEPSCL